MLELADGSVDGYEIAAADLRCEIVVLTACDSGNSLSVAAAWLSSQVMRSSDCLPRSLRPAAAACWRQSGQAEGDPIASIVLAFHRNLAQGAPADIALAQAQREFLDGEDVRKGWAYNWAPLVLTAVSRPIPRGRTGVGLLTARGSPAAAPA